MPLYLVALVQRKLDLPWDFLAYGFWKPNSPREDRIWRKEHDVFEKQAMVRCSYSHEKELRLVWEQGREMRAQRGVAPWQRIPGRRVVCLERKSYWAGTHRFHRDPHASRGHRSSRELLGVEGPLRTWAVRCWWDHERPHSQGPWLFGHYVTFTIWCNPGKERRAQQWQKSNGQKASSCFKGNLYQIIFSPHLSWRTRIHNSSSFWCQALRWALGKSANFSLWKQVESHRWWDS